MKSKKWIKPFLIVIVILLVVVGVPIGINESYRSGIGYMTFWGPADVLSYYGTILGSFVTILTVYATIQFTRRQIKHENYLNSELKKWADIDRELSIAIKNINPKTPLLSTMEIGRKNPNKATLSFQQYHITCSTTLDELVASLSLADASKLASLLKQIQEAAKHFCELAEEEAETYKIVSDYQGREDALELLKREAQKPSTFPPEMLAFSKQLVQSTKDVTEESLRKAISSANNKMVKAYELEYRPILVHKREILNKIDSEIRKEADDLLSFWYFK